MLIDRFRSGPLREEQMSDGGLPDVGGGAPPVKQEAAPPQDNKELNELKQRLQQMEAAVRNRPVPGQPQPQQPPSIDDLNREFFKNPTQMISNAMQYAQQQGAMQAIQTMAPTMTEVAMETARRSDPEVFDLLRAEIVAKMGEVPDTYRTNATVWTNAFNVAKGENIEKVLAHKGKGKGEGKVVANDGPISGSHRQPPAPVAKDLDAREMEFVRKFNLTPDEFRDGQKIMDEQAMDGKGPSSWDKVWTFDSHRPPEAAKRWQEINRNGGRRR